MPKKQQSKTGRGKVQLIDQLRAVVDNAEESRYAISQATGIDQAALSRFVHGEGGLSVDAINKLGEYFDLVLVQRQQGIKQPKGR